MKKAHWSLVWPAVGIVLLAACSTRPLSVIEPETPPPVDRVARIAAVGDIMLGGKAEPFLDRKGYDYPFAATAHLLRSADLAIGNLETPLTDRGSPLVEKTYLFRNPPDKVAPALKLAGFDVVTLANNHILDYGVEGLQDTIQSLQGVEIAHVGAGMNLQEARRPAVLTLPDGQTVGFLGYSNTFPEEFWATPASPGTAFGHVEHVRSDVQELVARQVDIIVVSFHWGRERQPQLRPYQPLLAHAAIDAGADLVLGHHPHILQGVERYKQGLILYSLGNYTFTTFSNSVHTSVVAQINFRDGRFESLAMTPININNFQVELQPGILDEEGAGKVFQELKFLSDPLGTSLGIEANQVILRDEGDVSTYAEVASEAEMRKDGQ
jgi:poly-gamma-glutamate synthesis protein (capsule biosynthesis protein)